MKNSFYLNLIHLYKFFAGIFFIPSEQGFQWNIKEKLVERINGTLCSNKAQLFSLISIYSQNEKGSFKRG